MPLLQNEWVNFLRSMRLHNDGGAAAVPALIVVQRRLGGSKRAKTSRGAGFEPHSSRPPAVEGSLGSRHGTQKWGVSDIGCSLKHVFRPSKSDKEPVNEGSNQLRA